MLSQETRTVLEGSCKAFHADFASLSALGPDEEFSVTVRVRRKRRLPEWKGTTLTHKRHARLYGGNAASVARVKSFARANGLRVDHARAHSREIVVYGTARAMQTAFSAELRIAEIDGRRCRVRQGELSLPADLLSIISSVTGLDNRPFAKAHYRLGSQAAHAAGAGASEAGQVPSAAFTPLEIASLYNFPAGFDGAGQTIAILELDGGFRPAELSAYFEELGIQPPAVTVVPFPGGGANNPGSNALDPFCRDAEVMLDIQVAGALAPGARILVYFARDDSDESFLAGISAIVHDAEHKPDIISISWGGPEPMATAQFREEFDQLLQTAAHLGITVCVATGDNAAPDFGAGDPRWDGGAHVDFPACSPWVLACGGTRISVEGGKIAGEEVWFEGSHDGAGGGMSRTFPLPGYQTSLAPLRAVNPDGAMMRGIPDISASASPASGYRILCNGQRFPDPAKNVPAMGGTSAVAPLWAALVARINQALGQRCGFLNPILYQLSEAAVPGLFSNPVSGTNGAYFAGTRWNPCTGLGSVDGARLLSAIQTFRARL